MEHSSSTWCNLLKNFVGSSSQKPKEEQEKEATAKFMSVLNENKQNDNNNSIPRFFYKKPTNCGDIYLSVRSDAQKIFLRKDKSTSILTSQDLSSLWKLLQQNTSPPKDNTERINYKDFKEVGNLFPLAKDYFKATNFLKFDKDKYGRIDILSFIRYVIRRNNVEENKLQLSFSDLSCEGYLTESDLDDYLKTQVQHFPFFESIEPRFREYYILVAQRKFFFFFDPKRTGRISINEVVTSSVINEFLEMGDDRLTPQELAGNWFSEENFRRIYRKYLELDHSNTGLLTKDDLKRYSPGLTDIFIERIFEEYQKYNNIIDFKQFIDFVLAMDNRKHPSSIQYIWRAIDVYHKNAVDTFVINMFYRAVVKKLFNKNKGEYKIDDIKDEIWDMIKPKNPNYITLQDVLKSSYGDLVLSMLIDAREFYLYDQKEFMSVNDDFGEMEGE